MHTSERIYIHTSERIYMHTSERIYMHTSECIYIHTFEERIYMHARMQASHRIFFLNLQIRPQSNLPL